MKNLTKILCLYGIILLTVFSCEEDEEIPCACGIENPQENIEWLNYTLDRMLCAEVYSIVYESEELLIISDCPDMIDGMVVIYDCQGEKVCEWGGIMAGGLCYLTDLTWEYYLNNRKLIYKQND